MKEHLKLQLPHPYCNITDRRILKKIEKIYIKHFQVLNDFNFHNQFKPKSIYEIITDSGQKILIFEGVRLKNNHQSDPTEKELDAMQRYESDIITGHTCVDTLYSILHEDITIPGFIHSWLSLFFVLLTVVMLVVFRDDANNGDFVFRILEYIVTGFFTLEYVGQWLCVRNKWNYFTRTMSICDVLSIIPAFVEIFVPNAPIAVLSILKIFRLLRLGKLSIFANPYAEIIRYSIKDMLAGSGSIIVLYITIATIFGGVLMVEWADEVETTWMGMWKSFATLFSGESQFEDAEEITVGNYIFLCISIFLGVLIISSIINTLGDYHRSRVTQFEEKMERIGTTLYEYYNHRYSDKNLAMQAFLWNVNEFSVNELYTYIDDTLLFKDLQLSQFEDPGSGDIEIRNYDIDKVHGKSFQPAASI